MKARLCTRDDKSIWVGLNKAYMEEELYGEEFFDVNLDEGFGGAGFDDDLNEGLAGENLSMDIDVTKLEEAFESAMDREDAIYLVIFEINGKVLGFANLVRFFSVWANGDSILIDDLFLSRDYRGLGYGKDCLKAVEVFAREKGAKRVQFNRELRDNKEDEEMFDELGYSLQQMGFLVKYL